MSDYSDQEIDLRPYIKDLASRWYWILGLSVLAGILAYVATNLLVSPVYEATALVSVSDFRQRVEFDPRIVTAEEEPTPRAYIEIALSDELLLGLREEVPEVASFTVQRLRSILEASVGSDPSLLRLTVRNTQPELAAELANSWAEQLVARANSTYGDLSEEQLLFFEQRLGEVATEKRALEQAYVDFQAQNRLPILESQFIALQQTHSNLLGKESEIESIQRDIDSLLTVLRDGGGERGLPADDQVTALVLRLRAFGGSASAAGSGAQWQLQLSPGEATAAEAAGLEQQVLDLQAALQVQAEQTAAALAELEPQILAVQRERQEASLMEAQMLRDIELAVDTQTALARTVEEKRITSQDTNTTATLASRSAVPTSPTGPRALFNALAAFVGVALLVVFAIVVNTWWQSSTASVTARTEPQPGSPSDTVSRDLESSSRA